MADRFHLVQNLSAAIKEQMSFYGHAHVRPILSEDAIVSTTAQRRRARMADRQSRQDIIEMLHALRQQGLSYSEISRRTGYQRRSIANWLTSNAPRDRHTPTLDGRLEAGPGVSARLRIDLDTAIALKNFLHTQIEMQKAPKEMPS
ncbi:hypothetical protein FHS20_003785 [Phyllobacterium endophyticum]|nr:hypothetical protein [Phyllobacterium endophyticum]